MSWIASLFGGDKHLSMKDVQNPLDMVVSAAMLASKVQEIDPIMDRVRQITASLQPGKPLSKQDEQGLLETYLQVEDYLTTREPLRAFTKQGLREHLKPALRESLNNVEQRYHLS
jgi:hypothetical protein